MKILPDDIVKCLPLLASILGDLYGIEIRIGGKEAKTDGKVIYLPSLPQNLNNESMAMLKGYIDHEAAHIRYTDFNVAREAQVNKATLWLFNAIEDWRVENRLAKRYPGCKANFIYLIKTMFLGKKSIDAEDENPAFCILKYILLTLRSWDVLELAPVCQNYAKVINAISPGLKKELDKILKNINKDCPDSNSSLFFAKQILKLLERNFLPAILPDKPLSAKPILASDNYFKRNLQKRLDGKIPYSATNSFPEKLKNAKNANPATRLDISLSQSLMELLERRGEHAGNLPGWNLGSLLGTYLVNKRAERWEKAIEMAEISRQPIPPMPEAEKTSALRFSNAMRFRLLALLQAKTPQQKFPGYKGRLNYANLGRFFAGNTKIFWRRNEQKGLSVAFHLLIDCSASMNGKAISMARQACYAILKTLDGIRGINCALTAFPGASSNSVIQLLEHGKRFSGRLGLIAEGSTPLAQALWRMLKEMLYLQEKRRLILLVTDGVPDSIAAANNAIALCRKMGFEIYGIGIQSSCIKMLLPGYSTSIDRLEELPGSVFELLQEILRK